MSNTSSCLSLAGSSMCPRFSGMSINPQNLTNSWPWFEGIDSVAKFDSAFSKYLSPDGQFAITKQEKQLGCANYDVGFVLQWEQTVLCGEFTNIAYSSPGCNPDTSATVMTCQPTCTEFSRSEVQLVNNTFICGASYNETRESTIHRDLSQCTDWSALASNDSSCVTGTSNEGNCGFGSSDTQLCSYCDPNSDDNGGGVPACCINSNSNISTCGYSLTAVDVQSSSTLLPLATSTTASAPSSSASSESDQLGAQSTGLSKGDIAGAVVGSEQQGPRGIEGGMADRSPTLVDGRPKGATKGEKGIENVPEKEEPLPAPEYPAEKSAAVQEPSDQFGPTNAAIMPRKSYLLSGGVLPASAAAAGAAATLVAPIPSRNRPTSRYTSDGAPSVMPSEASSEGRILVPSYPDSYSDRTIYPGTHVAAIYEYEPRLPDEIQLEVKDVVYLSELYDDGWAQGIIRRRDGRRDKGAIPLVCVTTLPGADTSPESDQEEDEPEFEVDRQA
ncbi:hypothetical protein BCR35DRAFT_332353 [Leucosporidium creatinivorum]|uniref:SH3 domain-containing protein n=1 Tax=Leucosporidium creatinivorum TaxID=106004 RepID=A0A1Y2F4R6_9BASI|nr:hypothetical protein BCR35DRAFT_332353 [Leucosporidium creatinivorum]